MPITSIRNTIFLAAAIAALTLSSFAQVRAPKEIFRDSDGNLLSNNEFVDIRLANFNYPDATIIKILPDGTKEFRLQKIPQEGMTAPSFSVTTLDGKVIRSTELNGKVVVLSFWFIGCPACREMEPKLNSFKQKFANQSDVVFLAMTFDPAASVKRYLSNEKFEYIQAADAKAAMDSFVFRGYPKNIVIGRDGKMVYWRSTIYAWEKFESVVRSELDKSAPAAANVH